MLIVQQLVEWLIDREQKYSETICSSASVSTTNPTETWPGLDTEQLMWEAGE